MIIDDPEVLEALFKDRHNEELFEFPPMTKFRLEPFDDPETDDLDDPVDTGFDTARLVDTKKLSAYGRRKLELMGPPKGAVHARLEAEWGKDVGHPVSDHTQANIDARRLVQSLGVPTGHTRISSVLNPTVSKIPSETMESDDDIDQLVDGADPRLSHATDHRAVESRTPRHESPSRSRKATTGRRPYRNSDDFIFALSMLAPSAAFPSPPTPEHQCQNHMECKTCQETPSHPWLPSDEHGREMATIVARINDRLPEHAQVDYGRMFNIERRSVAKKTNAVRIRFHLRLQEFAQRYNIVELHNDFATVQRKGENRYISCPSYNLGPNL